MSKPNEQLKSAPISERYKKDGYVVVEGLFSESEMFDLRTQIHQVLCRRFQALGTEPELADNGLIDPASLFGLFHSSRQDYVECVRAVQNLPISFALGSSERTISLVRSLGLRHPAFSTKPIITMWSQRTATSYAHWMVPAHQDWRSIQGSLNCLIIWVALDDVSPERGPLELIPGSHLWGLLPTVEDEWYRHVSDARVDDNAFESLPMKAGDAVLFSAFLVHRSGRNTSEDFRYSVQYRYNDLADESYVRRVFPTTYDSDRPAKDFLEDQTAPSIDEIQLALGIGT